MKKEKILLLFCIFVLCATVCDVLPIHGEEKIYGSVVRLHVLANSDSEEDQTLKLKVRDGVLSYVSPLVADCESREEAIEILDREAESIRTVAADVIAREGYSYSADVTLTVEDYPTRNYESMSFPSGAYVSLRVMLGEAQGQNWWCVLFPQVCTDTATPAEERLSQAGFTSSQIRLLTEQEKPIYKVKFKLVELFYQLFD